MRLLFKSVLLVLLFIAVVWGVSMSQDGRFIVFPQLGLAYAGDILAISVEIFLLALIAGSAIIFNKKCRMFLLLNGVAMATFYGIVSQDLVAVIMLMSVAVVISCVNLFRPYIYITLQINYYIALGVASVRDVVNIWQNEMYIWGVFITIGKYILILCFFEYILSFAKKVIDIEGKCILFGNMIATIVLIMAGRPLVTTQLLQVVMICSVIFNRRKYKVRNTCRWCKLYDL